MKVHLKRTWFGPDQKRYRAKMYAVEPHEFPDDWADKLPSDAVIVEPPAGVEVEVEQEPEPEPEPVPETFSEMAQKEAEATDPAAAFKEAMEKETGGGKVVPAGARGTDPKPKSRAKK